MQAIDFLRKGSYAPDIIKYHQTNILCILHVGKNVQVKLEKKIIISCNFGTLLFYTLIYSNTTLRYTFLQKNYSTKKHIKTLFKMFYEIDLRMFKKVFKSTCSTKILEIGCCGKFQPH